MGGFPTCNDGTRWLIIGHRAVGKVSAAVRSPRLDRNIALALVSVEATDAGALLEVFMVCAGFGIAWSMPISPVILQFGSGVLVQVLMQRPTFESSIQYYKAPGLIPKGSI